MVQARPPVREDITTLLAELVAIESVNPYFPGGERGERGVESFVAAFCTSHGLEVRRQLVLPGRENVIAELKVPGATRTLLLDSHMDTVSLDLMGPAGLHPRIQDNRMTGRGSCDDKASLAAMLLAIARLAANPAELATNVTLLASVDEEYLMRGAQTFAESGIKADGAIVGEPTSLDVVIAHKGFVRLILRTIGKAAHSSNPQLGDNAIYQMTEFIHELRPRLDRALAPRSHPLVGSATWSVGKISGGAAVNIVPERCTIEVDRRLLPDETGASALDEVDSIVAEILAAHPSITLEREVPFAGVAGIDTPPSSPLVRALSSACQSVRGTPKLVGAAYGTNASRFVLAGIPCVVFGPGDIQQAHTANEYVDLDQVAAAVDILEATARSFGEE
jgi:acetylornithine deacetylase/succinyl-diaminopimelate desuccinylase family protein